MQKRLLLSLSLLLASSSLFCQQETPKLNNTNTIIAWDFHDVLVRKNWSNIGSSALNLIKKDWSLLGYLFSPISFYIPAYRIIKNSSNPEEIVDKLISNYGYLKQHEDDLLNLVNQHDLIPESVTALELLKKQGYKNYLASNMGPKSYTINQKRFSEFMNKFDGKFIPSDNTEQDKKPKPFLEYFYGLRSFLNTQKDITDQTTIIFLDDSAKNIKAANESQKNIIGLHVTDPKNIKNLLNNHITLNQDV
ncbi:MAG: hypothetical protein AB7R69_01200 [Candidatus Babeliales bacterium]